MPPLANPEIELAISYAAPAHRPALWALWALDAQLAAMLARASDPMLARLRLTWWREALIRLDTAPAPAQPLLAAIATGILPGGVTGEDLAVLTDGWESLLVPDPLAAEDVRDYARGRGALFVLGGQLLGAASPTLVAAGEGWALADLAGHVRSEETAAMAHGLAAPLVRQALVARWPRALRPLGVVLVLAERDLRRPGEPRGAPRRVLRMVRHRITGR
ncbi:MAG: hypothetical protein C0476_07555 [Sphingomonas sp.]|nr:hypothetical protein [Sphingomonas sp.]